MKSRQKIRQNRTDGGGQNARHGDGQAADGALDPSHLQGPGGAHRVGAGADGHAPGQIAAKFNISAPTAMRYFAPVSYRCHKLPEVLSIDEFKGNAGGQKYQTILTDPKERKILDILPNRYESNLIQYFKEHHDRENVKYFVSDMNPHFREIAKVCFPKATIIADRYHVTRQAL